MCDQWMPYLKLPMTIEQFQQLPRNAAYKYEYFGDAAHISPRARVYHAALDLASCAPAAADHATQRITLRRFHRRDVPALAPVFAAAFDGLQPFGSLDGETRQRAAEACLLKTCSHGDGPRLRCASFVATSDGQPVGGILITLMPDGDPCDWDTFHWTVPPPADFRRRRGGQPHVTWIFVSPWHKGGGVGTTLLTESVNVLRRLGYQHLLSTFFTANESSMLWHWRSGFKLLAYPGSKRRMRDWLQQIGNDIET
jgi:hypothetical protein